MTPDEMRIRAELLFGERWKAPLAFALGHKYPRSVFRWSSGQYNMPEFLEAWFEAQLIERRNAIDHLLHNPAG